MVTFQNFKSLRCRGKQSDISEWKGVRSNADRCPGVVSDSKLGRTWRQKKVVNGLEASYAATLGKKSRSYSFPYGGDGGIEVYHTIAYRAAQTSPRWLWNWKELISVSIHFSICWSFHINLAPTHFFPQQNDLNSTRKPLMDLWVSNCSEQGTIL